MNFLRTELRFSFLLIAILATTAGIVERVCCAQDSGTQSPTVTPAPSASAEDAEPTPGLVSEQLIESLRLRVESAEDLSPEDKQAALDALTNAATALRAAADFKTREKKARTDLETVTDRREALQKELQTVQNQKITGPDAKTPIAALQQQLLTKQNERSQTQVRLNGIKTKTEGRSERLKGISTRLETIPTAEAEVEKQLEDLESISEPTLIDQAKRLMLLAQQNQLDAEPNALEAQLLLEQAEAGDDNTGLMNLTRRIEEQKLKNLELEIEEIEQAITNQQKEDATKRKANAGAKEAELEEAKEQWRKQLAQVYARTVEIIKTEQKFQSLKAPVEQDLSVAEQEVKRLEKELEELTLREERIGIRKSFGDLLRQQKSLLLSPAELRAKSQSYNGQFETAYSTSIELQTAKKEVDALVEKLELLDKRLKAENDSSDGESVVTPNIAPLEAILGQIPAKDREAATAEALAALSGLGVDPEEVSDQQQALESAILVTDSYIQKLDAYYAAYQNYADATDQLVHYINERILWIPSHDPISWHNLANDIDSIHVLVDPANWRLSLGFLWEDFLNNKIVYVLILMIWLFLIVTKPRQTQRIQQTGKKAGSRLNLSMKPTVQSLLMTISKAAIVSTPILFVGWRFQQPSAYAANGNLLSLGQNLTTVGLSLYFLEFVRIVNRSSGLGVAHFNWPKDACSLVTRQVNEFLYIAIPLLTFIAVLEAWDVSNLATAQSTVGSVAVDDDTADATASSETLLRITTIAIYLILARKLHQLTDQKTGVISLWLGAEKRGWLGLLVNLLHFVSLALPIAMAILTAVGFTYATDQLALNLSKTIAIVFFVLFTRGMFLRWLSLRQRRLALEQSRQKRAAMSAEEGAQNIVNVEDKQTDLAQVSDQTRRLLTSTLVVLSAVMIWQTWSTIVPAISYLEEIPGTGIPLAPLLAAIVVGILTATAARNVPGLFEIILLEWLPLQKSSRFAITTVTQYAIAIVGLLAISEQLGLSWESVQWLVAALSVGLGFGLQEIVANFVSGVIILFEQPVRLGDVVTIDGISGMVSRIQIRATTITDWDRKEYIVPNKEFITGKLLNWTLSDTTNRIVVEVGVAYGSDTKKVRELIMGCASDHPMVLREPVPLVTFEKFGDSSLNFVLRAFLPSLEHRLATIHELHQAIDEAFAANDIEIPFPQRDLHVRSSISFPIENRSQPASDLKATEHGNGQDLPARVDLESET